MNSALRDIFVIGLRDERIQRTLLSDGALTLDSALQKAVSMETASFQAQKLRYTSDSGSSTAEIHAVNRKSNCWRCGNLNHAADSCFYRNLKCHCFRQKGHKASFCKKKKNSGDIVPRNPKKGRGGVGVPYTELCTNAGAQEDGDL